MNQSLNQDPQGPWREAGRWRNVCRRPAFWLLVFMLGLILFVWPFIPTSHRWTGAERYVYLFCAWAFIIGLIILIAVNLAPFRAKQGKAD